MVTFILVVWFVQLWMIPLALLVPLFYNGVHYLLHGENDKCASHVHYEHDAESQEDEKISIAKGIEKLKEIGFVIQNLLGSIANIGESIQNVFNISVPFLSTLAYFILLLATFALYFIPLRLIIILVIVKKFMKNLLQPDHIPTNEIMNFLVRVPNNDQLEARRELINDDKMIQPQ